MHIRYRLSFTEHPYIFTLMTITELATASSLDIILADIRGEVVYTKLPSATKRRRKSVSWSAAAPKGAFLHNAVPGASAVASGQKASVIASY